MTGKADLYLQKAEEFEAKALAAKDAAAKVSYQELAQSYRQLASHRARTTPASGDEIEALVKRILGSSKGGVPERE
jgi:hypothetical protein